MTNTEIKLILLDYRNFDYIPKLHYYYIQNYEIQKDNAIINIPQILCPSSINLRNFLIKYKLQNKCKMYGSLIFYMNLLNFNGFSDWKLNKYLIKLFYIFKFITYSVEDLMKEIYKEL